MKNKRATDSPYETVPKILLLLAGRRYNEITFIFSLCVINLHRDHLFPGRHVGGAYHRVSLGACLQSHVIIVLRLPARAIGGFVYA